MINNILKKIKSHGLAKIENVFTEEECEIFKNHIEEILLKKIKGNHYVGNNNYQVIENYFTHNTSLYKLIYFELIDKIMTRLIDRDYVMLSSSARNCHINNKIKISRKTSGIGWHTDTRYIQDERIKPTLIYTSIIPLDDFEVSNGRTEFIPGSHLFKKKPDRNRLYKRSENLVVKKGSLVVIDTALWHKAGKPSKKSRWGIFTMYAPWFIKPYFQFDKIITPKKFKVMHPKIRQLLHFDSLPPKIHNESNLATLRRVRLKLKRDQDLNNK